MSNHHPPIFIIVEQVDKHLNHICLSLLHIFILFLSRVIIRNTRSTLIQPEHDIK